MRLGNESTLIKENKFVLRSDVAMDYLIFQSRYFRSFLSFIYCPSIKRMSALPDSSLAYTELSEFERQTSVVDF